jgi:signal transduction histidine kinase
MTKLMQSVVGQADKLSRLITQLLDVSRLKGGKLAIERQPVDLVELLNESIGSVHTGISGHVMSVKAPETLIAEVDPLRLEQVIVNLLNNAVKYSPMESEIEIVLSWPEAETVELMIKDQGPGIPLAEREHIFERFYQVRQGETPSGLGLGLYICREIVELHGGDVLAEFPDAGGTRFIVRLPISSHPPVTQII